VTHHLLFQTTCHLLWFFFLKGTDNMLSIPYWYT
jgi:hypothetical protein